MGREYFFLRPGFATGGGGFWRGGFLVGKWERGGGFCRKVRKSPDGCCRSRAGRSVRRDRRRSGTSDVADDREPRPVRIEVALHGTKRRRGEPAVTAKPCKCRAGLGVGHGGRCHRRPPHEILAHLVAARLLDVQLDEAARIQVERHQRRSSITMSDASFPVFRGGFFEPCGLPPLQWARPSATILCSHARSSFSRPARAWRSAGPLGDGQRAPRAPA